MDTWATSSLTLDADIRFEGEQNISFDATILPVGLDPTLGARFLLGVGAVGGLLGSLAADEMRILFGRPAVLVTAGVLVAAGEWLVAFSPSWPVAALGIALVAFAGGTFNVVGRSLRQVVVPDELLGRVIATFRVVGVGGVPVGAFLGGAIASLTSVRTTMALAAGLLTVAAVLLTRVAARIPEEHRR